MFARISELIDLMNVEVLNLFGFKFDTREEYAIEYLETMLDKYGSITGLDKSRITWGMINCYQLIIFRRLYVMNI